MTDELKPDLESTFGILADGLDALVDGRGWGKEHETARRLADAAPAMLAALESLFEECAMIHKHWGEADNTQAANAAIDQALTAITLAKKGDWEGRPVRPVGEPLPDF
jgi:hypothetical protein